MRTYRDGMGNNARPLVSAIEGDDCSFQQCRPQLLEVLARTSPHRIRGAPRGLDHNSVLRSMLWMVIGVSRMVGGRLLPNGQQPSHSCLATPNQCVYI